MLLSAPLKGDTGKPLLLLLRPLVAELNSAGCLVLSCLAEYVGEGCLVVATLWSLGGEPQEA